MELSIATATDTGGGLVVSFGSGNRGGRTQASARGRAGNSNASAAQVRALRARIRRAGITGNSRAARERRALLQQIDDNSSRRGGIRRRILANIADDLADL
jgi:hypothetical protein